jgi:hypothetical protein
MSYSATVLAKNPIRYYRINEASGTVAHDSGSQATNGTYTGPTLGIASLLPGTTDTEVQFVVGGADQYMLIPTAGLPTGASAWTIEVWAAIVSPVSNGGTALYIGSFSMGELICIESRTGNKWRFTTYGAFTDTDSAATFPYGTIHHLVATYDGTTITYYIDSVNIASGAATMNITYAAGNPYSSSAIGVGDNGFNGIAGQSAIYGYALSHSQVLSNYNAGITAPVAKILGNHHAFARVQ